MHQVNEPLRRHEVTIQFFIFDNFIRNAGQYGPDVVPLFRRRQRQKPLSHRFGDPFEASLPTDEIERLFVGTWSSPVAVILKAIGFHLGTIDAIYRARRSPGDPVREDLTRTKAEFIALSRPTAERIVRFYRTRKSVEFVTRPVGKM